MERRCFGSIFRDAKGVWPFCMRSVGGIHDPRQGLHEQVRIEVVVDGVGEQGRDPGASIVCTGPAIERLVDTFYP